MSVVTSQFVVAIVLLSPAIAAADDTQADVMAGIGIDSAAGGQGAYVRGHYGLSPTLVVSAAAFVVLDQAPPGPLSGTNEIWVEVGLEKLSMAKLNQYMAKGQGFFREWRAGGFFQNDVAEVGPSLLKNDTESRVIALYGGFGGGLRTPSFSATAAFDLVVAPLITEGDYVDDVVGQPVTYKDDGVDRFGGRFDMKLNFGKPHYGLGTDVQLGRRPGIDARLYALATVGIYLAL